MALPLPSMRSFAEHLNAPHGEGRPQEPPAHRRRRRRSVWRSRAHRGADRGRSRHRSGLRRRGVRRADRGGERHRGEHRGRVVPQCLPFERGRVARRARWPDARRSGTPPSSPPTRSTGRSERRPRTAPCELAPSARRTLVAMSGGVDSAAAAQLALDAGDEVVAVTLELWSDPGTDGEQSCCSPQAVRGARELAHRMGIPHVTLDLRERFRAEVVDTFLDGYAAGRTPNPCVRCNGEVRFDAMLELAGRARRRAARHGPLRAHRARRARPAHPRRRRPAQGPELHARQARPGAPRPAQLPARRAHEGRRARARARGRPAGGRQAREPGPLLRRRPRRPRLPPAPRRPPAQQARRDRRPRAAPSSAATTASTTTRSASGAASGSHRPEPLYVLKRDAETNRVVVGPKEALATTRVRARGRHPPPLARRGRDRPASLSRRAASVPGARPGRRKPRARARPRPRTESHRGSWPA